MAQAVKALAMTAKQMFRVRFPVDVVLLKKFSGFLLITVSYKGGSRDGTLLRYIMQNILMDTR